jgi:putative copper resistance protein D
MDEFTAAARFVHFASVTLLAGATLFRFYAGLDADRVDAGIRLAFDAWLRRVVLLAAMAAFLSAIAWADSLAVGMGGGWEHAFNPETFAAVLFDTNFGRVWVWRLALTALVIVLAAVPPQGGRLPWVLITVLAVALVASIAGVTHAAMHTAGAGALHQAADAVHLICSGFWLGGLAALGFVLWSARRDRHWLSFARFALPRFSRAGTIAISLLLLTGIVNAVFLTSLQSLFTTAYGLVLMGKICLFLVMLALALINRRVLLPRLLAHRNVETSIIALSRTVGVEQALGVVVLVLVSILGMLPPPH